jgi:hypothetical protein
MKLRNALRIANGEFEADAKNPVSPQAVKSTTKARPTKRVI